MKYDFLIEKYLKEAIGDTLGKLANIGANSIQNQQGKTVFDTLAKPGLPKKGNCINTNKDKEWENRLGVGKSIYVRFADPSVKKDNKTQNQPPTASSQQNQTPSIGANFDAPSGPHIWNGKEWINQNTKKPNSASGSITAAWQKQQSQKASQQKSNVDGLPEIKVELKIEKVLGNGMFYAIIQDRERYYSRTVQSPTTGKSYSKIDIIKTPIDKNNQNLFRVLMGRGTMETNFCFV